MSEREPEGPGLTTAVHVTRGAGIDAVHAAVIAVVDEHSKLWYALGDAKRPFFTRSALKPMQALPLVRTGACDRFKFDERELALACASHGGTDEHRALSLSMLGKLGLGADALQCGTELPLGLRVRGVRAQANEDQDPLRHNCSGKHAGFLALCLELGQPVTSYLDPDAPAQRQVRRAVAELCEVEPDALALGMDGCSAPNFAMSMQSLATGFKNLAQRQNDAALTRIRSALLAEPLLISGEGRLDYELALAFPGRVVTKGGAEAVLGIGFSEPPIGIAIKVVDGHARALGPILVHTLNRLGIIDDVRSLPTLARHERPQQKNAQQLTVGEIVPVFELRKV
jgi:L-asparaginase II